MLLFSSNIRGSESEAADLDACRLLLRQGSLSFDAARRFLPRAVCDPAVALYAFCREADDAIDGAADGVAGKLDWLRERLALAYDGRPLGFPADRAFARIVHRFGIPRALPEALLEGFAWDAEGRRYEDLPALRAYAVRVAGAVGAMMALLMGVRDPQRLGLAIDLGVAMQLSNIARDVGEDAGAGRLYLPLQWLAESGIDPEDFLAAPEHSPALGKVLVQLLDTADELYRSADTAIARLPMRCRLGMGAARLLYAEIGREVGRRGFNPIVGRAVVSRRRKAWLLATGLGGFALPLRPLSVASVPEAMVLLQAVAQTVPGPLTGDVVVPWWDLVEKLRWTIDLFARLEQRGRVGT